MLSNISLNDKKNNHKFELSEDSIEDFKAAFICVTKSLNEKLESSEDLARALQGCGRNPSQRTIDTYWRSYKKIGINEFCEIASQEAVITERELINAFRSIDTNENGYISYREFMDAFTTKGDSLTPKEIRKIMEEADLNNDKKLDYKEFSKLIIETIERAKKVARKQMKKILMHNNERDVEIDYRALRNRLIREKNERSFHEESDTERRSHRSDRDSRHFEKDDLRRNSRHSPPLSSNRSRNSSLSNRSNNELDYIDHNLNKRKSGSRLSFADEKDFDKYDKHSTKGKHAPDSPLKNMLKSELSLARSNESLRYENEKLKDHERDRSRGREKDTHERDSSRNNKSKKPLPAHQIFEVKLPAYSKITENIQEPKNFKKWKTKTTKGGFYFNESLDAIVSNSFALDLQSDSNILFSIEPYQTPIHSNTDLMNMDIALLIVKDNKNLTMKGLTEHKNQNKWCTRLDLKAGRYFLFPFTSGCHLKRRILDFNNNPPKLFQNDLNNKRTLSRQFKDALSVIFDVCDLDSNGKLSQDELNLHTYLTANESLSDEEWKFVGETVGFEKGELTKDGFIQLYKIEAQRDDTDVNDINSRLANMGFNKSLTIDQACPYIISVSSEIENFNVLLGEIYKLKTAEPFLSQIIEAKGNVKPIKEIDGLSIIEYHNSYWTAFQVQNNSKKDALVQINCSKSENCLSNHADFFNSIKVKPMKSKIGMFLTASNTKKEWISRCGYALE